MNTHSYRAWLQPVPKTAVRLTAAEDIPQNVIDELKLFADVGEDAPLTVSLSLDGNLPGDAYKLKGRPGHIEINGADSPGLLYGIYALREQLLLGNNPEKLDITETPAVSERMLNHWDNVNGHVERGYSGNSLFFKNGDFCYDAKRVEDYARMLASVGINRISLNNVNVTPEAALLVTEKRLPRLAELAAIFRRFCIKLIIAVDFTSPRILGGLQTPDPLDESVINWWKNCADTVYKYIPDLAGFLVKADSEFRDGPAALGRTQADGANVIARALAPHNGTVYWRCFVYNCMQDWRDTKTDRPKAAYDHFFPLDGDFDANVILQIKNGPSDFQVREPLSPLLGAMKHTRQAIEFQVTQEYTGQQIDLYALAVQWEEIFASRVSESKTAACLVGKEICAVCAVSNAGTDDNWTGHALAQCNLYAFGRLAWNPRLTAGEIIGTWARLTFGGDDGLIIPLTGMMMKSRDVYEKYTAPLGICWMVNIHHHYGPSVDGYEYMKWGTYHRANHTAIGVDRTKNGTGYTEQYDPWLAAVYDDPSTCPEELLLYFHRLPYNYKLKSGKTVLQHIYDTRFEGADEAEGFIKTWNGLKPLIPSDVWGNVSKRLDRQLENAREWRDVVNTYFYRLTGIPDEHGRKIYD